MNILLVVPRLNIGGAETYVATTAIALKQLGHSVAVASGGGMLANFLQEQGIKHYYVPIRFNNTLSAWLLEQIVRRCQIELIHANSAAAGIAAVKAKQRINIPVVYTAHGIFGHKAKEKSINQCDKIICVSEYVRRYAIKEGFTPDKLVTLYSGIDLQKFKPDSEKAKAIRKILGIPEDAFTIAIIARIKNLHSKGHVDVLKLLKTYNGAQNWHLLVIGKGKGLWKLKYHSWRHNLSQRVHYLGHMVNVQDALDGVDATVLPSNFETFGLVLIESMAMEKPVVTYAVGGTPEAIDHGRTGFLVEKNNLDELYQRLHVLANDKTLCWAMGQQGRSWVEERFAKEVMTQKLVEIYQEAVFNA
ncbi:glycosyltransferase family 4 protein [Sporomusa sphaeroides DSM 2875]|uniref:glycosyltransferase family 4 protein n=1 Tax=Sporomusa sphaeroides TaxID=47679 RepID=UPI00202FA151|nr:glycosyltransferase family 4 protein [Sporomusa sphaeroides]MCM0758012.1 glycosyltransferase family 4 protein [Sporomusa sphaeroides DSM 2875]